MCKETPVWIGWELLAPTTATNRESTGQGVKVGMMFVGGPPICTVRGTGHQYYVLTARTFAGHPGNDCRTRRA